MAPSNPSGRGPADVRIGEAGGPEPSPASAGSPFRLLVAADFTARSARGALETGDALAARATVRVDLDTLDEALSRWQPEVEVPLDGEKKARLRFRELEDFHPDRVFDRVPGFAGLREASEALAARPPRPRAGADLLGRILEGASEEEVPPEPVDTAAGAMSDRMRALLRHPAVRGLEAAWRGVDFLVRRLELDGDLSLHLLDVSREEIEADLGGSGDLAASALQRIVVERTVGTPGGEPWGALVLLHDFGAAPRDLAVLWRLAQVSSRAGTPVLAGASARLLGCEALAETPDPRDWAREPGLADAWDSLRSVPEARWIGLALPRILLRLPYGSQTEPVEAFDFEELSDPPAHEEYLWGSAALAPALLLGEAFLSDGWDLRPGQAQEIGGLPLPFEEHDGQKAAKPCAETTMTLKGAEEIGSLGLMPLLTIKGTDLVRLGIFQSIAHPHAPLSGRWKG